MVNYMNRKNDVIINEENTFYTVAMRGMVAFPKMVMHFDIARSKSVKAVLEQSNVSYYGC